MVALAHNLANKHAMEMLLTGDMVPAARAAEMGLVNQVVPSAGHALLVWHWLKNCGKIQPDSCDERTCILLLKNGFGNGLRICF